ncbi:hypothetical protein ACJJTC_006439 [Scirpophaga incertulas]
MQWMQRSRSCPQCRILVTENSIIRTFPTGLSINTDQDVTLMQCQLDDALLKVKQLEAIVKQRNDNVVAVKEELTKKINEVRIVEDKLRLQTDTCRIYEIKLASYIDHIKELDTLQRSPPQGAAAEASRPSAHSRAWVPAPIPAGNPSLLASSRCGFRR